MAPPSSTAAEYVKQAADLMNVSIHPDYQAEVIKNIEQIQLLAQLVIDFPLPPTIEAAPIFQP